MKKVVMFLVLIVIAQASYAEIQSSDYSINEVQVRSASYYAPEWSNGATLAVSPKVTFGSCNQDRVYFDAETDKAMLSVALSAQAQKRPATLIINDAVTKDGICKLEFISIK